MLLRVSVDDRIVDGYNDTKKRKVPLPLIKQPEKGRTRSYEFALNFAMIAFAQCLFYRKRQLLLQLSLLGFGLVISNFSTHAPTS